MLLKAASRGPSPLPIFFHQLIVFAQTHYRRIGNGVSAVDRKTVESVDLRNLNGLFLSR